MHPHLRRLGESPEALPPDPQYPSLEERVAPPIDRPQEYLAPSAAYEAKPDPKYRIFDPYFVRFLGTKPIEVGSSRYLGWGGGLLGLNYVGTSNLYVAWDEARKHGENENFVSGHEFKHNGELFHGHDLAEYWNRMTDLRMDRPSAHKAMHEPRYAEVYKF